MDFDSLQDTQAVSQPINPIEIFEGLPSLSETYNDLWRGQAEALEEWYRERCNSDNLVTLNTGAGKTVVGLLIAQSMINEGLQNVLYVCSTIDLVEQTAREAAKIGIRHTCRIGGEFSNLEFEQGKTACITTYAALFNGHSLIRRKYFPEAIIFDDAHVASDQLRSSFTMTFASNKDSDLVQRLQEFARPAFEEINSSGKFHKAIDPNEQFSVMLPPGFLHENRESLLQIFRESGLQSHADHKFPFAWLEDHLDACCFVISRGKYEIAPVFLPSRALDVFGDLVQRRVYLSATLESKAEFIRSFGRKPDRVIVPRNDAGNGERLILFGANLEGGVSTELVERLTEHNKVVIAVPSYLAAKGWSQIATPVGVEDFSRNLHTFREASSGAFILVSRIDGIDLPHNTCRLMVIDGLPSGNTLLDRYQWEQLRMNKAQSHRIANRLTQLFGRINRGRNDFGIFLIEGRDINNWLSNKRNLALLPDLLVRQIHAGQEAQSGLPIDTSDQTVKVVTSVLNREKSWLRYYDRTVKSAGSVDKSEEDQAEDDADLVGAALAEMKFSAAMWIGDSQRARECLEKNLSETARHDRQLGGWHRVWVGATFDQEGDRLAATNLYDQARSSLGVDLLLPRTARAQNIKPEEKTSIGDQLVGFTSWTDPGKYQSNLSALRRDLSLILQGSSRQAEEGVRILGEFLGFRSSRPDNEDGTGPDVLWLEEHTKSLVGFELKTDKKQPATYFKKDVAQAHDHVQWTSDNYEGYEILTLAFVGPDGVIADQANPSEIMSIIQTEKLGNLKDRFLALVDDVRRQTPLERQLFAHRTTASGWTLSDVLESLDPAWACVQHR